VSCNAGGKSGINMTTSGNYSGIINVSNANTAVGMRCYAIIGITSHMFLY